MCKAMPVIPVNKVVVDPKKNSRKKWRAEEEERHKKERKGHISPDSASILSYGIM
jgi:hypothetical protein